MSDAGAEFRDAARAGEPDRYLAALLAPSDKRPALVTLAAYAVELARIPARASEPHIAEIRLQWWRDALGLPDDALSGHPLADAVRAVMRSHGLAPGLLLGMIDARSADIWRVHFPDREALESYVDKIEGAQFAMAAQALDVPVTFVPSQVWRQAGWSYGLARLLAALPEHLSRGWQPLPLSDTGRANVSLDDLLRGQWSPQAGALLSELASEARGAASAAVAASPASAHAALLPLASVPLYLKAVRGITSLREPVHIDPLRRMVRLGWAFARGRIT